MPDPAVTRSQAAGLRVEYRPLESTSALPDDVLFAIAFGDCAVPVNDPRFLRVGLAPLHGAGLVEIWRAQGLVRTGSDGLIRYVADDHFLAGAVEIDERQHGGITRAAEVAYSAIRTFLSRSAYPSLLRVWNYFDAINEGTGDTERYKRFCVGRAAGLGDWLADSYPAATVIGRRDGDSTLQVYWLARRKPGMPLANPRQTNPHLYPRDFGPTAPQFSRAMLISPRQVMISGTASIVGHATHHHDDLRSQLNETLDNLGSVLRQAASHAPGISPQLGAASLLKIYLREPAGLPAVEAILRERLPSETPCLILAGDVCRADLLVEADCVQGSPDL
jgi:chorismate lyase/3-hydroxybenzoate synthase